MLEALFSFSGRLGRADFIRWSAFQAILSALMLAGIHGFSTETIADLQSGSSIGAVAPNIGMALVLGIALVIFPSSALIIKRLRDVGLPPWPCFLVISFVDALIAGVVPHSDRFAEGPFAGLAFSMVVTVLLALVPGRGSAGDNEGSPADWVERAAAAEARLIEDRRRPKMSGGRSELLDQAQALENIRRRNAPAETAEPQGFGRRRDGLR
jgi:uncharacterized membrane protein YhaH (DUF805 family)